MRELVALDLPGGSKWVDALRGVWDGGDAVLPVDPRLPARARAALFEVLRPTVIHDGDGRRSLSGGRPVETGDAAVIATSGTTGDPKGVTLTHDAIAASAKATTDRLGVRPGQDRWLACLPLAHIGGFSVVTRALLTGTAVTVLPQFVVDVVDLAARSSDQPCSLISLVVSAFRRIRADRWRRILLGGSALPSDLPDNAVRTYGMTETGSGVVYDGVPLDGVEIRADCAGQLEIRAPMLLRCYRTADGDVDPRHHDGWLRTGDAGSVGADGVVRVDGRIGDVIVTGGEKVWPESVERALADGPGVAEVAVCGVDDADWGHRVVAFVVPIDRADLPTLDGLRAHAKQTLPAFAVPRQLVLTDELPKTALGKVIRRDLPALREERFS